MKRQLALLNSLKDAIGDTIKGITHLIVVFWVDFNEIDVIFFGEDLSFLTTNLPIILQIIFVADEENLHVRIAVASHFLQPLSQMLKCLSSRNVID